MAIADLQHYRRTPDGTIYPYSNFDYAFYARYLTVFDDVHVLGRLEDIPEVDRSTLPAPTSGPGLTFHPLPDFLGPVQFLRRYPTIRKRVAAFVDCAEAVVLRLPSYISTMIWHEVRKQGRPYLVEVVGDPWQATAPGVVKSRLRPFLRAKWTWDQKRQCRGADLAAYVTEFALQRRYPPGGWSTHYSSIELPDDFIIDEARLDDRINEVDAKARSGGPWRLCLVGSLWHLAKSPDVLIDAVAHNRSKGLNLALTIVGGGSLETELKQRARDRGLGECVAFTGHLPPGRAINEQLDLADVFVLPSRTEGLPRVIIEAMARGLPCIASNIGGIPELVEPPFLVVPGDMRSLADAIAGLVSDPEAMKRAARRNVAKAAEFRIDVLQARRVEVYQKLRDTTERWLRGRSTPSR